MTKRGYDISSFKAQSITTHKNIVHISCAFNSNASSLIFVIKLDLVSTLSMLEEVRRDSEVYWPQYSLRQVHAHIYTEMKPRTQLSE